jgi:hypothetical protein
MPAIFPKLSQLPESSGQFADARAARLVALRPSWHGRRGLSAFCRDFRALALSAALALAAAPARATAAPSGSSEAGASPGTTALVTGIAVAGASLAYGGTLLTTGRGLAVKRDGLLVMDTGLTLAPLIAHGVAGEWARGALFALAPAAGEIGMAVLLAAHPDAPVVGKHKSQRIYPVMLTVSVLGSALGIFDATLADERLPHVALAASGDGFGAELSGKF